MVRFINLFEVPQGSDDEFMARWSEVNVELRERPGYRGHELHRAQLPAARYRFVNYVEWESADHWRAAHDARFRALVGQPAWSAFSSTPALYDVVHADGRIDRIAQV